MDTRLIFRDLRRRYRCGDADPRLKQAMVSCEAEGRTGKANPPVRLPGKAAKVRSKVSVPQTDTGGRVEDTKALG